ncbi:hypothetical protein CRV08_11950 [Halarcobacter ebronensis]|uniref:HTH araC/xylS-type domain-containing protein n=2 Tax=Halarcobacter ebronensis TaxID=1462615 RepID=A0A4Q0Y9V1_9BACT|nr:hypothetical protein CRV08_11950 [Halarcobacter ebronensis]
MIVENILSHQLTCQLQGKITYASEDIATSINMSQSNFFKHFKSVTSFTPLQYIKIQRLQLARRLLKFDNQDVTGTAFAIGYQSLSQFSNDYSKYFGINPSLEIKKI